jgi:hypothetical protein
MLIMCLMCDGSSRHPVRRVVAMFVFYSLLRSLKTEDFWEKDTSKFHGA